MTICSDVTTQTVHLVTVTCIPVLFRLNKAGLCHHALPQPNGVNSIVATTTALQIAVQQQQQQDQQSPGA